MQSQKFSTVSLVILYFSLTTYTATIDPSLDKSFGTQNNDLDLNSNESVEQNSLNGPVGIYDRETLCLVYKKSERLLELVEKAAKYQDILWPACVSQGRVEPIVQKNKRTYGHRANR